MIIQPSTIITNAGVVTENTNLYFTFIYMCHTWGKDQSTVQWIKSDIVLQSVVYDNYATQHAVLTSILWCNFTHSIVTP